MNIKKAFVDENVIVYIFDKSRKNFDIANKIVNYCINKDINLYTSCDLITTVYYILSKKGKEKAVENIKSALDIIELIPFDNDDLNRAIYLMEKKVRFKDLEDTLQYVLVKKEECDLILTNDKDFYSVDIKVITTSKFIKEIGNRRDD